MILDGPAVRHRSDRTRAWALASGLLGLVASALLIAFFALARPFGGEPNAFGRLGTANDVVLVGQFLTLIPVALSLRHRLPATSVVRRTTAAGVGGMVAVALLQALLVGGLLDFDIQVVGVCAAFLPVFGWVFAASASGHRTGTLPRLVTRSGLLIGAAYPLGLLICAPGLLFGWGSVAQLAFVVPGVLLGSVGWLGLPIWPLLLARHVFISPPQPLKVAAQEGAS